MATNFALSSSLASAPTVVRIPHKTSTRSSLAVCNAKKVHEDGINLRAHTKERAGISASIVATLAGALVLADTNGAIAAQGDVYAKLGIPPPSGSGGVVLSAPQKKAPFQSQKSSPEPPSKPVEAVAAPTVTPPKEKSKPAAKKPAPKPQLEAKKSAPKLQLEAKKPAPKIQLEAKKPATKPTPAPKVKVPIVQKNTTASKKTEKAVSKPSPDVQKKVQAGGGGLSLPSFQLPSFSAPSLPSSSPSLPSSSDSSVGKQQALTVAGIEAVLAIIASSVVGSLFSKKSRA